MLQSSAPRRFISAKMASASKGWWGGASDVSVVTVEVIRASHTTSMHGPRVFQARDAVTGATPSIPILGSLSPLELSVVFHSFFMSSTENITISPSNLRLIIDALGDYALRMGIDFARNPFAEQLRHTNTPDDILNLLQEREEAFTQYRNRNRTLINCFSPAVRVLHTFSGTLGAAGSLVSFANLFPFSFRCDRFKPTSLALPSCKGYLCRNRCSSRCTSI
jgi:hypothetical protein